MSWQEPIIDRTVTDTETARKEQSNTVHNKGAWNYDDLNRIEGNFDYVIEQLKTDSYHIPHKDRKYTETVYSADSAAVQTTYTDWQEKNIPYKSEIDRIRRNHNNMVSLFLRDLGYTEIPYSNYVNYEEANKLEEIERRGKEMFENMKKAYIPCGTITCGGDLL